MHEGVRGPLAQEHEAKTVHEAPAPAETPATPTLPKPVKPKTKKTT